MLKLTLGIVFCCADGNLSTFTDIKHSSSSLNTCGHSWSDIESWQNAANVLGPMSATILSPDQGHQTMGNDLVCKTCWARSCHGLVLSISLPIITAV